mmetsp:Transcript_55136/g.156736  ORF Transcript_55136/g.156736 Transcript_55136/m.156736 type:complete len:240 (+) Transcript_55136:171-890(+)
MCLMFGGGDVEALLDRRPPHQSPQRRGSCLLPRTGCRVAERRPLLYLGRVRPAVRQLAERGERKAAGGERGDHGSHGQGALAQPAPQQVPEAPKEVLQPREVCHLLVVDVDPPGQGRHEHGAERPAEEPLALARDGAAPRPRHQRGDAAHRDGQEEGHEPGEEGDAHRDILELDVPDDEVQSRGLQRQLIPADVQDLGVRRGAEQDRRELCADREAREEEVQAPKGDIDAGADGRCLHG